MGGKNYFALFLIGHSNELFVSVDPHTTQDTVLNTHDLSSYETTDTCLISIKDVNPTVTFCFSVNNDGDDLWTDLKRVKELTTEDFAIAMLEEELAPTEGLAEVDPDIDEDGFELI